MGQAVRLASDFHVWKRGSNDDGFAERLTMTIGYQRCEQVVAMSMRADLGLRTISLRSVTGNRITAAGSRHPARRATDGPRA